MVLLLLLTLALLLWMLQGELDGGNREDPRPELSCPGCRAEVEFDWMVCPHCQQQLRESCSCCHKGKMISQAFCPHCGCAAEKRAA